MVKRGLGSSPSDPQEWREGDRVEILYVICFKKKEIN